LEQVGGDWVRNPVKAKLKAGKPSVGTWLTIGHPDVSEILADLGFDWVVFDMEHGPLSVETVQGMMQSMSYSVDCVPMVRVGWNDLVLIKRALDIGAYGLVIPWVNTREDAVRAVSYCKYPPEGIRGCGPRRAARRDKEYIETANEEILILVQIETETAIKNLDEIFSVKGVDACFIGPSDLSMSLGVFRKFDHPKFRDAIDKVLRACKKSGVAPGMHCSESRQGRLPYINDAIAQGFQFCALDSDTGFLTTGTKEALRKVEGWKH